MDNLNKDKVYQCGTPAQIEQMIRDNNLEGASKLLAGSAINAAMKRDFVTADRLRDKLLAVNPNALFEIIYVNEVIDREKLAAIGKEQLVLWHQLYEFLEPEIFTALYYRRSCKKYQADEVIARQGEINSSLYFIEEGRVVLSYHQGAKEIFIKKLNPGEIFGEGSFFDVSVWTVSVAAVTAVKLRILEREDFLKLAQQYPGFDGRFADFCHRSDNISELLQKMASSRRSEKRYPIDMVLLNNLLGPDENSPQQQFKADLDDISRGGLLLTIHVTKKGEIRPLLGKCLVSLLPFGTGTVVERKGEIVGVTSYDYMDKTYSVHVRFDYPISEGELQNLILHSRKQARP